MTPTGRHWEQVYEFGAHRRILPSLKKSSCGRLSDLKRRRTLAWRVRLQGLLRRGTAPDRKVDEGDSLDPGDTVADPLLDARFLSVQRNSAGNLHKEFRNAVSELVQSPWAGWPVSGPRTFLWCCKSTSEHALHPLAHHSRFVQLSGFLSTDPAAQEHELLCRALELGLTFDQLQGAKLSCFELLARRLQMLEMKLCDKVAGSLFGGSIEEDSHIYLGTGRTRVWAAHDLAGVGGVCFWCAGERNSRRKGTSQVTRRTIKRAARQRQEETTEPCGTGLGVLLAPFSRKRARGK